MYSIGKNGRRINRMTKQPLQLNHPVFALSYPDRSPSSE
jgi:hypothetical protein